MLVDLINKGGLKAPQKGRNMYTYRTDKRSKETLKAAVAQLTAGAIPGRKGALLSPGENGRLMLSTWTGETLTRGHFPGVADGTDVPAMYINIDALRWLIKAKIDTLVTITRRGDNELDITAGERCTTVATQSPDVYGKTDGGAVMGFFDDWEFKRVSRVMSRAFFTAVEKVAPYRSLDGSRYVFRGVLLEIEQDRLQAVATDSHALACVSVPSVRAMSDWENVENLKTDKFILSYDSVKFLEKFNQDGTGLLSLFMDGKGNLKIQGNYKSGEGYEIIMKGIDAKFPKWKTVIPDEKARVGIADFSAALIRPVVESITIDVKGRKREALRVGLISPDDTRIGVAYRGEVRALFESAIWSPTGLGNRRESLGEFPAWSLQKICKTFGEFKTPPIVEWQEKEETAIVITGEEQPWGYVRVVIMPFPLER